MEGVGRGLPYTSMLIPVALQLPPHRQQIFRSLINETIVGHSIRQPGQVFFGFVEFVNEQRTAERLTAGPWRGRVQVPRAADVPP